MQQGGNGFTAWANGVAQGIVSCVMQELKIRAGRDFQVQGHNSYRVFSVELAGLNPHYLRQVAGLRDQMTMYAGLDEHHPVRVTFRNRAVFIEIGKPVDFQSKLSLDLLLRKRLLKPGLNLTLGFDTEAKPVSIDFAQPDVPHLGIFGTTQSGKTTAGRLIAWELATLNEPDQAQVVIIDVAKRGHKWRDFSALAHLAHPLIIEVEEAERFLTWAVDEISRRGDSGRQVPRLFIIIDEVKDLNERSPVAVQKLAAISSMGAEFGIHLVIITQWPQINLLKSAELKRNMRVRLTGPMDSADAAANALGWKNTGAESLEGVGDFLLRHSRPKLDRILIAFLEQRHVGQLPMVTEVKELPLPEVHDAGDEERGPGRPADDFTVEQEAVALFKRPGIDRLRKDLGVGTTKAYRLLEWADAMRAEGERLGYGISECPPSEIEDRGRSGSIPFFGLSE